MIYLRALIGTGLLMVMAGVAAVGVAYIILSLLHAPHNIEIAGEVIAAIAVAIASIFVFRMTLETEKELVRDMGQN